MRAAIAILAVLIATHAIAAPEADRAWAEIVALRKGPGKPPGDDPDEAVRLARGHLSAQEKALSGFLVQFPADSRRHEAEIELAGVTSALGASLSDRLRIEKSIRRLAALENAPSTPSTFRADAAFQRITTTMQTVNLAASSRPGETAGARNTILEAARNFASRYPEDRRAARLLAEAATLLDDQPPRKRKVLEEAATLARDEGTRQRIMDDLRRLDLLGKTPAISFRTLQGGEFSLADKRGKVAALVFWAGWSPPSLVFLSEFAEFVRTLPQGRATVATVSLDRSKEDCRKTLQALGISDWPAACDGAGWDSTVARQLGINALPTVFVFDAQGRLRALNAREDYRAVMRTLLDEKPAVTR